VQDAHEKNGNAVEILSNEGSFGKVNYFNFRNSTHGDIVGNNVLY